MAMKRNRPASIEVRRSKWRLRLMRVSESLLGCWEAWWSSEAVLEMMSCNVVDSIACVKHIFKVFDAWALSILPGSNVASREHRKLQISTTVASEHRAEALYSWSANYAQYQSSRYAHTSEHVIPPFHLYRIAWPAWS